LVANRPEVELATSVLDLTTEAEAAKAAPQNVRAELSHFLEPRPQNI